MYAGRFGQMVIEDDPDTIAFRCLDGWSRGASIEAPKVESPARYDGLSYRLGSKMKDFYATVNGERQVVDIRSHYGYGEAGIRLPVCGSLLASRQVGQRYGAGREAKN